MKTKTLRPLWWLLLLTTTTAMRGEAQHPKITVTHMPMRVYGIELSLALAPNTAMVIILPSQDTLWFGLAVTPVERACPTGQHGVGASRLFVSVNQEESLDVELSGGMSLGHRIATPSGDTLGLLEVYRRGAKCIDGNTAYAVLWFVIQRGRGRRQP